MVMIWGSNNSNDIIQYQHDRENKDKQTKNGSKTITIETTAKITSSLTFIPYSMSLKLHADAVVEIFQIMILTTKIFMAPYSSPMDARKQNLTVWDEYLFVISRPQTRFNTKNILPCIRIRMMTSSNGNCFRVTGHLCGDFPGPRWIPRTKASDAGGGCCFWSAPG